MPEFLEASVRIERRYAGLVEDLLLGQGALAVTLTDCSDTPIWEPAVGETPLWEVVTLTGLFEADTDAGKLAAVLSLAPGVRGPQQVDVAGVEERDWVRAWMDRFEPMRFGQRLWIVPTGHDCPDPEALKVHLDPGLAFGTGTHATTRLALEWIDAAELKGKTVLDFGCGSGVLGIAAALKGAARVTCIDNDPQAVLATRQNAGRNGVADRLQAFEGNSPAGPDGSAPGQTGGVPGYDIVIANILAGVLTDLADELSTAVRPGGVIVLTGILAEQADEVEAAYANQFSGWSRFTDGEWVLLHGKRVSVADQAGA